MNCIVTKFTGCLSNVCALVTGQLTVDNCRMPVALMKYLAGGHGRRLAWALLLALALGLPAPAQSQAGIHFAMAAGKTSSTLPFELIDNRVFVEVQLNGKGRFHFILDTGAGGFSVVESVARELDLKIEDAGEGQGVERRKSATGEPEFPECRLAISNSQISRLKFYRQVTRGKCSAPSPWMACLDWNCFVMWL